MKGINSSEDKLKAARDRLKEKNVQRVKGYTLS